MSFFFFSRLFNVCRDDDATNTSISKTTEELPVVAPTAQKQVEAKDAAVSSSARPEITEKESTPSSQPQPPQTPQQQEQEQEQEQKPSKKPSKKPNSVAQAVMTTQSISFFPALDESHRYILIGSIHGSLFGAVKLAFDRLTLVG